MFHPFRNLIALALCLATAACGGGGGDSSSDGNPPPPPAPTYAIGGTVNGLVGTVVLQNNAGNDLTVTTNGAFRFTTSMATGGAYGVTVKTEPATQTCVVTNGVGTVNTVDITTVVVTCTNRPTFPVGGTITGLNGDVKLVNVSNSGQLEELTLGANGPFTFLTPIAAGNSYAVTVERQPPNQICLVTNGIGTIAANAVVDVAVTCTTNAANAFSVGGTVTGLNGTVVLTNTTDANQSEELSIAVNGSFTFPTALVANSAYTVSVKTSPADQTCTVTNASGVIGADNVTNVVVTCATVPIAAILLAEPGVRSATLSWNTPVGATSFNVYVSSQRNCDIGNAGCLDGPPLTNVTSPLTVEDLDNGQAYFFKVESLFASGERLQSNEAGARPNVLAFGGFVHALAAAADGTVYVGGEFTEVGIATGSAVPLDAVTGQILVPDFPMVSGPVFAIAADGEGGWYLGGNFTSVGGVARNNAAHVLADGTVDLNWNPNLDGGVNAIAVSPSGDTVYVGGGFTFVSVNGQPVQRNRLAAFEVDGDLTAWNPNASNATGSTQVNALAVSGNIVIVGGSFTRFGGAAGIARNRLAALNNIDGAPTQWNPGLIGFRVNALALSDGIVYVGGDFSEAGGFPRANLAAFALSDATGVPADAPTAWDPRPDNVVLGLAAVGDDTVYAAGFFSQVNVGSANPPARRGFAAFDTDGQATGWNAGVDGSGSAIAVSVDGRTVYLAGEFTRVNTNTDDAQRRRFLAQVDATTGVATGWTPPGVRPDVVTPVVALVASGNTVYAGGSFTSMGSAIARDRLAAVDASGALTAWNPGANAAVDALKVSGDTVYVGGRFSRVADTERGSLAAIDVSGELRGWNPNASGGVVSALAVSDDGLTVYAGGSFTQVNGIDSHRLAAINLQGALVWADPNVDGTVNAIVAAGGRVYAGGGFANVGATNRRFLAAFDAANGALIPQWSPRPDSTVNALAASGTTLYAGGFFRFVNADVDNPGLRRNNLAEFDLLGAGGATPWDPDLSGGSARTIVVSGQTVFVGGSFSSVGTGPLLRPRSNLAAFDAGGDATPWDPGAGSSSSGSFVKALAVSASGATVYVGGQFNNLGNNARGNFGAVDSITGESIP